MEICMMSYMKYLQSMGIMHAGMYAGICYNLVLSVLCYLCVHVLNHSFVSLAWCHVVSVVVEFLLLVALTLDKKEVRRTLVPPTLESVLAVGDFLVFGFSGCVMMCAEWWAFELLTIFASMISSQALSAQTIMLQAITIFFMFPLGIGISTGAIVGNALGAGHKQLAISIGYLSMSVIFLVDLILCPLLLHFRRDFVELFTSDPAVIFICVHQCFPLLAAEIFVDGAQAVSCGVLRGAGKQSLGAAVNIGAYYCIALPIAWYLCFTLGYEVLGLMIGVCAGVFIQTFTLCCFIICRASYIFEGLAIDGFSDVCCDDGDLVLSPGSVSSVSSVCSHHAHAHAHHHHTHHLGSPHRRPLSMDGVIT
jgi:multidrug resistance protein, MATE family